MKKVLAAGMAAAFVLGGGVSAQVANPAPAPSGISNPRGMVENFDIANLGPILTELGVVWAEKQAGDGTRFIEASIGGQLTINVIPSACINYGVSNCVGVNFLALWRGGTINPQTVAAFNQSVPFVSAGALSGNAGAFISRYDIADYGIPRGNISASLANFVYLAEQFGDLLNSGATTVSQDGFADDNAARYLNGQALPTAAQGPKTLVQLHRESFDALPVLVRNLIEEGEAPINKIRNLTKN